MGSQVDGSEHVNFTVFTLEAVLQVRKKPKKVSVQKGQEP